MTHVSYCSEAAHEKPYNFVSCWCHRTWIQDSHVPTQQNQVIEEEALELFSFRLQHSFSMCDVELLMLLPRKWRLGLWRAYCKIHADCQSNTIVFLGCRNDYPLHLFVMQELVTHVRAQNYFTETCVFTNQRCVKLFRRHAFHMFLEWIQKSPINKNFNIN